MIAGDDHIPGLGLHLNQGGEAEVDHHPIDLDQDLELEAHPDELGGAR